MSDTDDKVVDADIVEGAEAPVTSSGPTVEGVSSEALRVAFDLLKSAETDTQPKLKLAIDQVNGATNAFYLFETARRMAGIPDHIRQQVLDETTVKQFKKHKQAQAKREELANSRDYEGD